MPLELYSSLRQDAVLLASARGKPGPEALLKYLRGDDDRPAAGRHADRLVAGIAPGIEPRERSSCS